MIKQSRKACRGTVRGKRDEGTSIAAYRVKFDSLKVNSKEKLADAKKRVDEQTSNASKRMLEVLCE